MELPEPIEFVILDDFDLIFLVDDVFGDRGERQLQAFRVLSDDAEKRNGSLYFDETVAFEERDAAPRAREPVAKGADERGYAFLGRQPGQRRVDNETHGVIFARLQAKARTVVGLPRIGVHARGTNAVVDGAARVNHAHPDFLRHGLPSGSVEEHRERDVALEHRRVESDLHRPVVEAVGSVGDEFLVDVEILVVADDDGGSVVDRLDAKRRRNQVKRVGTLLLPVGDVGGTLDEAIAVAARDVVRFRFRRVVFRPFQLSVTPETAGARGRLGGRGGCDQEDGSEAR